MGGYSSLMNENISVLNMLFGYGFWEESSVYLTSLGELIFKLGIAGLIYIIVIMVATYQGSNKLSRSSIIMLIVASVGTLVFLNVSSVVLFSLIYSGYNSGESKMINSMN